MRPSRVILIFFLLLALASLGTLALARGGRAFTWLGRWLEPPAVPAIFDPAFVRLTPQEVAALPLAVRFDAPLGSPSGALTYNAQPFRMTRHLGDDLNGIGGQNSDLGDPVHASGAGRVIFAAAPGTGWGNMVILAHRVPGEDQQESERVVQTVYAHLGEMRVAVGQLVQRGDVIGTVGTADGLYLAHLHFEVRTGASINPSVGYADAPLNRVSPEEFLARYRGAPPELLNPPPADIKQPVGTPPAANRPD